MNKKDLSNTQKITRRQFIWGGITLTSGLVLTQWKPWTWFYSRSEIPFLQLKKIPGEILGASSSVGHKLREGKFPAPTRTIQKECVIVGGGISGLSAGWRLQKKGLNDFLLLELESETGGNSRSGENEVSAYPWGAHYIPIPSEESIYVRELFEELGVIQGYDSKKFPIYNDFYLCSEPQERLWIHGRWQEGLIPQFGVPEAEQKQIRSFLQKVEEFRHAKGNDGRPAFSIPLELSSRDPRFLKLDQISFYEYLSQNGFSSKALLWYLNYCCRDDYGTRVEDVSAWAGIHYFAARAGRGSNAASQSVLTWPEGNGWLANQLRKKICEHVQTHSLVSNINRVGQVIEVDSLNTQTGEVTRYQAQSVIFAAPQFVARHVIQEWREKQPTWNSKWTYAPWIVANLTLKEKPLSGGAPLSWDNVAYESSSLGYVVATHQRVGQYPLEKTVVTYYQPLSDSDPAAERKKALEKSVQYWKEQIVADLALMHPGIEDIIERIDVWVWGHGMIRPVPGFIWGPDRKRAQGALDGVYFAHSDQSGISIFEEAQYWGVQAAEQVLKKVKKT